MRHKDNRKTQRPADMLGSCFCRQRFAHSWITKQIDDKPLPFLRDKVVKADISGVCLHKRLELILSVGRKNKVGKCLLVPLNILDLLHIEFD